MLEITHMKTILAMTVVAASVFATAVQAAPVRHSHERSALHAYGQATQGAALAHDRDIVTFGGRVIGEDPDPNIRTQMLHDPVPSEY